MSYTPPIGLRNAHINTILGSNGPRKLLIKLRSRTLQKQSREVLLPCRNSVQLHGEYTSHPNPSRGLVILIHGWEGCSTSSYLLSTASYLYAKGFSVFRLHLRDHGPTHHLNKEPFLAIRLDEVLDAIEQIQEKFPSNSNKLSPSAHPLTQKKPVKQFATALFITATLLVSGENHLEKKCSYSQNIERMLMYLITVILFHSTRPLCLATLITQMLPVTSKLTP